MNPKRENESNPLERAITFLRGHEPTAAQADAALERVGERLTFSASAEPQSIHSCADVRALAPAYRAGRLGETRRLLVTDHLHQCVACRHWVEEGVVESEVRWEPAAPVAAPWNWTRLGAVAALMVVAAGLAFTYHFYFGAAPGPRAAVASVEGSLLLITASGETPLAAGREIGQGERIRTAAGSHAFVRVADGSVIEMNERAQFSVSATRRNTTIELDRGNIIVQAAKRRTGHLYVAARDARVAVTGTVFSVDSGTLGTAVAVIEGEVRVTHNGREQVLHSGDTAATASRRRRSVEEQISWSENLDRHLALLAQFSTLAKKVDAQVAAPAPRFTSAILPLVPANTVLYVTVPNLADQLRQAEQLLEQQVQESPALASWWQKVNTVDSGPTLKQVIEEVTAIGDYLGNEVVVTAAQSLDGQRSAPAVLAQVKRGGLCDYLRGEAARLNTTETPIFCVLPEELATATPPARSVIALVRPDFLILSPHFDTVRMLNAQFSVGASGFAGTGFGQRVAQAYSRGAGFLLAVDLGQIAAYDLARNPSKAAQAAQTGLADARYMVIERREFNGTVDNHAILEFAGQRHGIASWLGAPAPMGALDFISPDASLVVASVAKSPALMFDDLVNIANAGSPDAGTRLAEFEARLGISLREDLAGALGTDATVALDGPVLPVPSWKIVAEVYNSGRLQTALAGIVAAAAREAAEAGRPAPQLTSEEVNGRTYYTLSLGSGAGFHYTYADGYLVGAASRGLVDGSLQVHASGVTLARSSEFRALLPSSGGVNVSALLYQNLTPVLAPLGGQLSASQMNSLKTIAADARPTVVVAYGEADRIEVASNSRLFGFDLQTLAISALLGNREPAAARQRILPKKHGPNY